MRDAVNDGREAVKILREHYRGKTIISLYTELTSLRMKDSESVTDYILRAESSATSLKSAGETISDSLLIAMVLKGLRNSLLLLVQLSCRRIRSLNLRNLNLFLEVMKKVKGVVHHTLKRAKISLR